MAPVSNLARVHRGRRPADSTTSSASKTEVREVIANGLAELDRERALWANFLPRFPPRPDLGDDP